MTLAETSKFTGLSKSHLRKLTSQKKIKFSKPTGKIIFFNIDDINSFLSKNQNEVAHGKSL